MDIVELLQDFRLEHTDLKYDHPNLFKRATLGLDLSTKTLHRMHDEILKHPFKNETREVHFFKEIKPEPYSYWIYYKQVLYAEEFSQVCLNGVFRKFIQDKINALHGFYREHKQFWIYLQSSRNDLDAVYFLRKNNPEVEIRTMEHYRYHCFSTSYDHIHAKLLALPKLYKYYEKVLYDLDHPKEPTIEEGTDFGLPQLRWTGSKVALIELIYALHHSKILNHGRHDIQEVARVFQRLFGVELSDMYKVYGEIRGRKKTRTKFLDELRYQLNKGMERADEF